MPKAQMTAIAESSLIFCRAAIQSTPNEDATANTPADNKGIDAKKIAKPQTSETCMGKYHLL